MHYLPLGLILWESKTLRFPGAGAMPATQQRSTSVLFGAMPKPERQTGRFCGLFSLE